jgi:hypothetical protein
VAGVSILSRLSRWCELISVAATPPRRARNSLAIGIAAVVERLEERRLLSAIDLTAEEQLVLELVNRARANPQAEADRFGIGLNDGLAGGTITSTPKQPLAPNQLLENPAVAHTLDMLARDFFSHTNPDGKSSSQRATDAGYNWNLVGENIAYQSSGATNRGPTVQDEHQGLFESAGHRQNILNPSYREIGVGERWGNFQSFNVSMLTEVFGNRTGNSFVTGVAFTDLVVTDNFYSIGEAVVATTVTAVRGGSGESYVTTTGTSGGYSLQVPDGTYAVTLSGGSLASPITKSSIAVAGANAKVDFVTLNLKPTIALTPNARSFAENGSPVILDSGSTVADTDSLNFDAGSLAVTISGGANANDRVEVRNQGTGAGQIGVAGGSVSFGGTTIGSLSGGVGTTPLTVAFNSSATAAAAQALLRNVTFRTSGSPINTAQRTIGIVVSDGDGGVSTTVSRSINVIAVAGTANVTRMNRAYNPNADYHFFTIAAAEFTNAVNAGYHDETAGRSGFSVLDNLLANTTPIHRLYNLTSGRHYYTLNDFERDVLVSIGWRFEKDEGFMYTAPAAGTTTIYRLYNSNSGVHLYTENATTKSTILATFAGIWVEHSALGNAFAVIVSGEQSRTAAVRSIDQPVGTFAGSAVINSPTLSDQPLRIAVDAWPVDPASRIVRSRFASAIDGTNSEQRSTLRIPRRGLTDMRPPTDDIDTIDELFATERRLRELELGTAENE